MYLAAEKAAKDQELVDTKKKRLEEFLRTGGKGEAAAAAIAAAAASGANGSLEGGPRLAGMPDFEAMVPQGKRLEMLLAKTDRDEHNEYEMGILIIQRQADIDEKKRKWLLQLADEKDKRFKAKIAERRNQAANAAGAIRDASGERLRAMKKWVKNWKRNVSDTAYYVAESHAAKQLYLIARENVPMLPEPKKEREERERREAHFKRDHADDEDYDEDAVSDDGTGTVGSVDTEVLAQRKRAVVVARRQAAIAGFASALVGRRIHPTAVPRFELPAVPERVKRPLASFRARFAKSARVSGFDLPDDEPMSPLGDGSPAARKPRKLTRGLSRQAMGVSARNLKLGAQKSMKSFKGALASARDLLNPRAKESVWARLRNKVAAAAKLSRTAGDEEDDSAGGVEGGAGGSGGGGGGGAGAGAGDGGAVDRGKPVVLGDSDDDDFSD